MCQLWRNISFLGLLPRKNTYNKLLDELDVGPSLLGQVIVRLCGRGRLVPSLKLLVLNATMSASNRFLEVV
jgi:hypothetical protein